MSFTNDIWKFKQRLCYKVAFSKKINSNDAYVTASRLSQAYVTKNIEIQTALMLQSRVYEKTDEVETTLML